MGYIKIHQELIQDLQSLLALCPFQALEQHGAELAIGAGCRMCRMCIRKGGGVFEYVEDASDAPAADKSLWRGIAVVAELSGNAVHPVTWELLGKARELADKTGQKVFCLMFGSALDALARQPLAYGADEVYCYDHPELRCFRIEPCTAVLEDFIRKVKPCAVLIGGTVTGRSLAPRAAARFRTGLTADCTQLDISADTDLDQIRPAYGGNIMAHINTPRHRPQFATVRYKIFPIPERRERPGRVISCTLPEARLRSNIRIQAVREKPREVGIEDAEVIVAAGRGVKQPGDLAMLEELAGLLNGRLASTRALVEAGWVDPRHQIGLSGRTVKPRLLIACGISGAIQFVAGMNGAEHIVAINSDASAPIFKVAHVGIVGDLYQIVPALIARIKAEKEGK